MLRHHDHGPTIGQAVPLVSPRFLKSQTLPKSLLSKWQHTDALRKEYAVRHVYYRTADGWTTIRMGIDQFGQYRNGRQKPTVPQGRREVNSVTVMMIKRIGQSKPVSRVGKDAPSRTSLTREVVIVLLSQISRQFMQVSLWHPTDDVQNLLPDWFSSRAVFARNAEPSATSLSAGCG